MAGGGGFKNAFQGCAALSSVSMPELRNITNGAMANCFVDCAALKEFSLPKVERIDTFGCYRMLRNVPEITSMTFPELTGITPAGTVSNASLGGCNYIREFYFPKLEYIAAGNYLFNGDTQLTAIHFPAAQQAYIESHSGYATLWGRGAGNATVYFDL